MSKPISFSTNLYSNYLWGKQVSFFINDPRYLDSPFFLLQSISVALTHTYKNSNRWLWNQLVHSKYAVSEIFNLAEEIKSPSLGLLLLNMGRCSKKFISEDSFPDDVIQVLGPQILSAMIPHVTHKNAVEVFKVITGLIAASQRYVHWSLFEISLVNQRFDQVKPEVSHQKIIKKYFKEKIENPWMFFMENKLNFLPLHLMNAGQAALPH